jgi:hypothetical protein
MAQSGRATPELRYRKAWMLIQFARNYEMLGDTGKQWARANEAYRLLARLAVEKHNDDTYQRDLAVAPRRGTLRKIFGRHMCVGQLGYGWRRSVDSFVPPC